MGVYRTWANRLWGGTQTWNKCPAIRKAGVKEIMRQDVAAEDPAYPERNAERYEEIIGEPYVVEE